MFATVNALLLARWLKPEGYGVYGYAFSWLVVLGSVLGRPMGQALSRWISRPDIAWGEVRRVLREAVGAWVGVCVVFVVVGYVVSHWLVASEVVARGLRIGLLGLPAFIFLFGLGGVFRAVGMPAVGSLFEKSLLGGFILVGVCGLEAAGVLTPVVALWMVVGLAWAVAFAGLFVVWRMLVRHSWGTGTAGASFWRNWPLLGINSFLVNIANSAPVFLVGFFASEAMVGYFQFAYRTIGPLQMGLYAVNMVIEPLIVQLWARKEKQRLQRVVRRGAQVALALAVAIFAGEMGVLWLAVRYFLPGYEPVLGLFAFMSVAQLVNVATGSVGLLLAMTGKEQLLVKGSVVTVLVSGVVYGVAIPLWGVWGAIAGMIVSYLTWNGLYWWWVRRQLGLRPTAIGI